jgi:hypothetical protein
LNLYDIVSWLLLARVNVFKYPLGYDPSSPHLIAEVMVLTTIGILGIKYFQLKPRTEIIYGIFNFVMLALLMIGMHESIDSTIWILFNSATKQGYLQHFSYLLGARTSYFTLYGLFWYAFGIGFTWFWRSFRPKFIYWTPYIAFNIIWLIIGMPVTNPLPDGFGIYYHYSLIVNLLELLEVFTFCIGFYFSFPKQLVKPLRKVQVVQTIK